MGIENVCISGQHSHTPGRNTPNILQSESSFVPDQLHEAALEYREVVATHKEGQQEEVFRRLIDEALEWAGARNSGQRWGQFQRFLDRIPRLQACQKVGECHGIDADCSQEEGEYADYTYGPDRCAGFLDPVEFLCQADICLDVELRQIADRCADLPGKQPSEQIGCFYDAATRKQDGISSTLSYQLTTAETWVRRSVDRSNTATLSPRELQIFFEAVEATGASGPAQDYLKRLSADRIRFNQRMGEEAVAELSDIEASYAAWGSRVDSLLQEVLPIQEHIEGLRATIMAIKEERANLRLLIRGLQGEGRDGLTAMTALSVDALLADDPDNPELITIRQHPELLSQIAEDSLRFEAINLLTSEDDPASHDRIESLMDLNMAGLAGPVEGLIDRLDSALQAQQAALRGFLSDHQKTLEDFALIQEEETRLTQRYIAASLAASNGDTPLCTQALQQLRELHGTLASLTTDNLLASDLAAFAEFHVHRGDPVAAADYYRQASTHAGTEAETLYYQVLASDHDPKNGRSHLDIDGILVSLLARAQSAADRNRNIEPDDMPVMLDSAAPSQPPGTPEQVYFLEATLLRAQYRGLLRDGDASEDRFLRLEDKLLTRMRERTGVASASEVAAYGNLTGLVVQRYASHQGALLRFFLGADEAWTERLLKTVDSESMNYTGGEDGGWWPWQWFAVDSQWVTEKNRTIHSDKVVASAILHCHRVVGEFAQLVQPFQAPDHDDPYSDLLLLARGTMAFHARAYGLGLPVDGLAALKKLRERYPNSAALMQLHRDLKERHPQLIVGGHVMPPTEYYDFSAGNATVSAMLNSQKVRDAASSTQTWSSAGTGTVYAAGCLATGGTGCVLGGLFLGGMVGPRAYNDKAFEEANSRQVQQALATGVPLVGSEWQGALYANHRDAITWSAPSGMLDGMLGAALPSAGVTLLFGVEGGGGLMALGQGLFQGMRSLGHLGLDGAAVATWGGVVSLSGQLAEGGRILMQHPLHAAVLGFQDLRASRFLRTAAQIAFGPSRLQAPLPKMPNLDGVASVRVMNRVKRYLGWHRADDATGEYIHIDPKTGKSYIYSPELGRYVKLAEGGLSKHPEQLWRVSKNSSADSGAVYKNPFGKTAHVNDDGTRLLDGDSGRVVGDVAVALPTRIARTSAGEKLYVDPVTGQQYIFLAGRGGYFPYGGVDTLSAADAGVLQLAEIGGGKKIGATWDALMTTAERVSVPFLAGDVLGMDNFLPMCDGDGFGLSDCGGWALLLAGNRFGVEALGLNRGGQRAIFVIDRLGDLYKQHISGVGNDSRLLASDYIFGTIVGQARGNALIRALARRSLDRVSSVRLSLKRVTELETSLGATIRTEAVQSAKLTVGKPKPGFMQRHLHDTRFKRWVNGAVYKEMAAEEKTLIGKLLDVSNLNGTVRIAEDGTVMLSRSARLGSAREVMKDGIVRLTGSERRTLASMFLEESQGGHFHKLFGRGQRHVDISLKPILNARGLVPFQIVHDTVVGTVYDGLRYSFLMGGDFWNAAKWTAFRSVTTLPLQNALKIPFGWDTTAAAYQRLPLRNFVDPYLTRHFPLWEGQESTVKGFRARLADVGTVSDFVDMHIGPGLFEAGGFARHRFAKYADWFADRSQSPNFQPIGKAYLHLANLMLHRPFKDGMKEEYYPARDEVEKMESHYAVLFEHVEASLRGETPNTRFDYKFVDLRNQAASWALVAAYVHQEDPTLMSDVVDRHSQIMTEAFKIADLEPQQDLTSELLVEGIEKIAKSEIQ